MIYFPKRERSQERTISQTRSAPRAHSQGRPPRDIQDHTNMGGFSLRGPEPEDQSQSDMQALEYRQFSKSPKFAQQDTFNQMGVSPVRNTGLRKGSDDYNSSQVQRSTRNEGSARKAPRNPKKVGGNKKAQQKILRDKAMNVGRNNRTQLNQTHLERPSATEYNHVESKIRDEVKYHKELSRQYKKMRRSIQDYTETVQEKFSNASSSQNKGKEKFVLVEKDENRRGTQQNPFEQSGRSGYPNTSRLLESTSSPQRSMYLKQSQYSNKSPSYSISLARSRRSEIPVNNENFSQSKASGAKGTGGMLDIANSFLNSPFMQHLSNYEEGKSSRESMASSINPSGSSRNQYPERFGKREIRDEVQPRGYKEREYQEKRYIDEGPRQINRTKEESSKYLDLMGNYRTEKTDKDNSILRESGNRRYADYFGGKESGKLMRRIFFIN